MGFKPKARQQQDFDRVTFPAGPNTFTLASLRLRHFDSTFKPEGQIKIIGAWKDEEGDEFPDFLTCPKEFAYNEKSAFWNRIAALAGFSRNLTEEDLEDFEISIEGIDEDSDTPWEDLRTLLYRADGKPQLNEHNKPVALSLTSVKYKGQELIGQQAVLNLKKRFDDKGQEQEGNSIAADGAMPLSALGGGKKKSGSGQNVPPLQVQHAAMP